MMDGKKICALLIDICEQTLQNAQTLVHVNSSLKALVEAVKDDQPQLAKSFQEHLDLASELETQLLVSAHSRIQPVIDKLKAGEL